MPPIFRLVEKISIKQKSKENSVWVFEVMVGEGAAATVHSVTVPKAYWEELTHSTGSRQASSGQAGQVTPEELVRKSFEFLLQHEPKESILQEFELPVIQKYFPEYEAAMRQNSKIGAFPIK